MNTTDVVLYPEKIKKKKLKIGDLFHATGRALLWKYRFVGHRRRKP